MAGSQPIEEIELDWDAIELQALKYDNGDRSPLSLRAKMLEMAYRDGYNQCDYDRNEFEMQMALLIGQPCGNA